MRAFFRVTLFVRWNIANWKRGRRRWILISSPTSSLRIPFENFNEHEWMERFKGTVTRGFSRFSWCVCAFACSVWLFAIVRRRLEENYITRLRHRSSVTFPWRTARDKVGMQIFVAFNSQLHFRSWQIYDDEISGHW